jgi:hypothetical protein
VSGPRLVPNADRDLALTTFRQAVCQRMGFTPFVHQAQAWLAADGLILTDTVTTEGHGQPVLLPDQTIEWRVTLPRPQGRAHVIADLGSFKVGKSAGGAMWVTGFAAVPNRRIKLIGVEYDTCVPEFEALLEALCSERGMNLPYTSLQNRPRDGRMFLDLTNGTRYEARSWERKDGLKGKEDDCYLYCECFQLPGLECYTDFKQNLVRRDGYAYFATTPDRPWVKVFHERGHNDPDFPTWQCVCGVARDINPFTYSASAKQQDRHLMTREKFAIAYEGQLGEFVGSVYSYQRGQRTFTTRTHPHLWKNPDAEPTLDNLQVPRAWTVIGGADTGTFTSASIVAFDHVGTAFVLFEAPNYRYVGGRHEWLDISIPEWAATVTNFMARWGVRGLYADRNSQFRRELQHHGLTLFLADAGLEQRTEIAREYFQHERIFLAPWLQVLPYELEQAEWPEQESLAGKFGRLKQQDHTLDTLEHVLARRPHTTATSTYRPSTWLAEYAGPRKDKGDPHLGIN